MLKTILKSKCKTYEVTQAISRKYFGDYLTALTIPSVKTNARRVTYASGRTCPSFRILIQTDIFCFSIRFAGCFLFTSAPKVQSFFFFLIISTGFFLPLLTCKAAFGGYKHLACNNVDEFLKSKFNPIYKQPSSWPTNRDSPEIENCSKRGFLSMATSILPTFYTINIEKITDYEVTMVTLSLFSGRILSFSH